MIAAAILVLAATAAVVAAIYIASGDRLLRARTKRRALITTHDGTWFAGVLVGHDRRSFLLTSVTTEGENGAAMPVDGEVLVLGEDVAHIQFP